MSSSSSGRYPSGRSSQLSSSPVWSLSSRFICGAAMRSSWPTLLSSRAFSRAQRHSSLRLVPFRSTKRLPVKTAPMPKSPARKYAPSVTASVQSTASVPKRTNRIKYPRNCRLFFSLVTGNLLPLARLVVFGYSKRRCWSSIGASIHLQDFLDRWSLDELLYVLLELEAVRGGDRVQVVRELKERVRHARVAHLVQASLLAHAPSDRAKDRVGHAGEISQGLMPVLASTKINLRHCLQPDHLENVYYDPGLDRIAGEERDGAEELPVGDELPCEGLHEACELGVEEVEERFGRELRNSPAVLLHGLEALERTSVGGLDKTDLWYLQDRAQNPVDELGPEVFGVSVDVHDEVASRHGECAPHSVALAVRTTVVAHELVLGVDLSALRCGHFRGTVRRVSVDSKDLVYQRMISRLAVYGVDLVDDPAHGVGDVAAGQDRADRKAEVALAGAQSLKIRELPVVIGAMLKPFCRISVYDASITCLRHTAPQSPA